MLFVCPSLLPVLECYDVSGPHVLFFCSVSFSGGCSFAFQLLFAVLLCHTKVVVPSAVPCLIYSLVVIIS